MTTQVNRKVTVRRHGISGLTIHLGFISRFISIGLVLGELSPRGATKMADPAPYPDSNSDTDVGPGREYPGTPRWVKVFGTIVIVLVLLVVIIIFIGGHTSPVQHGP